MQQLTTLLAMLVMVLLAGAGAGFILCAVRSTHIAAHLFTLLMRPINKHLDIVTRFDLESYLLAAHPLIHELYACDICLGTWLTAYTTALTTATIYADKNIHAVRYIATFFLLWFPAVAVTVSVKILLCKLYPPEEQ